MHMFDAEQVEHFMLVISAPIHDIHMFFEVTLYSVEAQLSEHPVMSLLMTWVPVHMLHIIPIG